MEKAHTHHVEDEKEANISDMLSDVLSHMRLAIPTKLEFAQMTASQKKVSRATHLERLEDRLAADKEERGVSMNAYKAEIRRRGICLSDCKEYGPLKLKEHLRAGKLSIVPLSAVKHLPHAKKCLTTLGN